MDANPSPPGERIARLEERMRMVQQRLDEIDGKVDTLVQQGAELRGGKAMFLGMLAAAGAIGGLIGKFVPVFGR